jgi:hypothetical protein
MTAVKSSRLRSDYEALPDYWPRPAARDRMAATKGMSANKTDGFIAARS